MGGAQFGANFEFEFKVYLLEFGVVAVSFCWQTKERES